MTKINPNPPRGERGNFLPLTIKISPEILELISVETLKRKMAGEIDADTSAIIREALVEYLGKKN